MHRINFSRKFIFGTIILITVLLLCNVIIVYENNKVITHHKELQHRTELIQLTAVEMIRALHAVDLGLRGYALLPENKQLAVPYDSAIRRRPRLMDTLLVNLKEQNFPMHYYDSFKVQVDRYFSIAERMRQHLDRGDTDKFMEIFKTDPGFGLQKVFRAFITELRQFEEIEAQRAKSKYEAAVRFNSILQTIVFFITVPTLFYLGYYSSKSLTFAKRLHQAEAEKADILVNQNQKLEMEVQLRTHELLSMNEEITTQNEEIITSNEQLVMQREQIEQQHTQLQQQHEELKSAKKIIEQQHSTILQHNTDLVHEVDNQTTYLSRANTALKERNAQLEQFAYIISHNLRGPLSRIQGLSSIMDLAATPQDIQDLAKKMSSSTLDLDRVIKDLSIMIDIPYVNENAFTSINLGDLVHKIIESLSVDIEKSGAIIHTNFREHVIRSLPAYIESIFFNLIQNALKYRSLERPLVISISTYKADGELTIEIEDNGLGIDTQLHKQNLFMPYKRFHLHVEGRGLGLYLVRARVEALKGKIEVESHVNSGSRFRISFPG
ncbi:sensor histidine kinase [Pseudochryseolinea flava]|uniref:histidine kinase n=1 Tax=Pseudochryseolinea flava TaxID=2059302 RepID=A0A364XWF7_9BACT|nr:ATP-binding protein [Pseudochryseolinea flava]RAV98727.1 hypothetical protein DQQ10_22180 [Pseudochryseolinea flava]